MVPPAQAGEVKEVGRWAQALASRLLSWQTPIVRVHDRERVGQQQEGRAAGRDSPTNNRSGMEPVTSRQFHGRRSVA